MKLRVRTLLFCAALAVCSTRFSSAGQTLQLIDIPAAEIVDDHAYDVGFRFYSGGGILSSMMFGVFPRVNIGFSWDIENVIGSRTIDVQKPGLAVKLKVFDGIALFPALALGYEGQGYLFDHAADEYLQREKGVYLAATGEMFIPGLEYHLGGNIYDFSEDVVYGFFGISAVLYDAVGLIAEYDSIHTIHSNRLNAGIRYYVTPSIYVDLAGRDMGTERDAERIVRVSYMGSF